MWRPLLAPRLSLLDGRSSELARFFQEAAHHALHGGAGQVLWCDGDHGFNPHEYAELNLTRGHAAEEHAERLLVKRCLTPFQWYTTLSRLLPDKIACAPTALAIVHPFDRPISTEELADWEQEDYVRFIVPHLRTIAKSSGVPILLGVDMARWWRSHPTLARLTREGVEARWSIAHAGGRWQALRDDGLKVDSLRLQRTTLLDYLEGEHPLAGPVPRARRVRRTRIVHRENP